MRISKCLVGVSFELDVVIGLEGRASVATGAQVAVSGRGGEG